jgi:hypothetical protein
MLGDHGYSLLDCKRTGLPNAIYESSEEEVEEMDENEVDESVFEEIDE